MGSDPNSVPTRAWRIVDAGGGSGRSPAQGLSAWAKAVGDFCRWSRRRPGGCGDRQAGLGAAEVPAEFVEGPRLRVRFLPNAGAAKASRSERECALQALREVGWVLLQREALGVRPACRRF